jgi:triacylglycerol esterase/lipase EstA (alpha/beta hydrolase family)
MRAKWTAAALIIALVILPGCASTQRAGQNHDLRQQIAGVDSAYRNLQPNNIQIYNASLRLLGPKMERDSRAEFQQELTAIGVKLDRPAKLPVAHYELVRRPRGLDPNSVGIPLLVELDTSHAPVYPPDGLLIAGALIYKRSGQTAHLFPVTGESSIELKGTRYPLAIDNYALGVALRHRTKAIAQIGLHRMLHPAATGPKTQIYLIDPYDPNKIPLLLVHGLQSTPVTFLSLVNAIRMDPELSGHFQVWTFLYGSGTPVLFNALTLRQELEKTVRALDPNDHDFATRHVVVVGHSMGGLMAHTLVSSSGDKLWRSLFSVPPEQLRGNTATIREFDESVRFRPNPRVVRIIFLATPHRGSQMADTWIGRLAQRLIRLPVDLQTGIVNIAAQNRDVATPEALAFHSQLNFSAIHTLSPRDPVLQTLAELPIEVPFHSIIGQRRPGPVETSSDGVVKYASSHLDGAASELLVQSDHGVTNKPQTQTEIKRILQLELQRRR